MELVGAFCAQARMGGGGGGGGGMMGTYIYNHVYW